MLWRSMSTLQRTKNLRSSVKTCSLRALSEQGHSQGVAGAWWALAEPAMCAGDYDPDYEQDLYNKWMDLQEGT